MKRFPFLPSLSPYLTRLSIFLALFGAFLLPGTSAGAKPAKSYSVADLKSADDCRAALKGDTAEMVRRKAFKKLLYSQDNFEEAVALGLKDRDGQIRRTAIYELFMKDRSRALPVMKEMLNDPDPSVCIMILELSRSLEDKAVSEELAGKVLRDSKVPEVRKAASRVLGFNFFKEPKLYSNDPANDHEVICLQTIDLPKTGWRLKLDESEIGHRAKQPYFLENLDDSDWQPISIGLSWEKQGIVYDGIAWYRLKITLPEMPAGAQAAELHFFGVDECAWVWVNGGYVGQHNMGTRGWNIPFKVECTKELHWGKENTIVVRVEDAEQAGGIYKGIALEVLK